MKPLYINIVLLMFVFSAFSSLASYGEVYKTTLSVGSAQDATENTAEQTFTYNEFPKFNNDKEDEANEQTPLPNYTYSPYPAYKIGPRYRNGFCYNGLGWSYNCYSYNYPYYPMNPIIPGAPPPPPPPQKPPQVLPPSAGSPPTFKPPTVLGGSPNPTWVYNPSKVNSSNK